MNGYPQQYAPQYGASQQQQLSYQEQQPLYGAPQHGGASNHQQGAYQEQQPYNTSIVPQNHNNNNPLEYVILGSEMQLVEIDLSPGQVVIAEAGAMMYMENDIEFTTKLGDGSEPKKGFFKKLLSAGGRWLTGESLFLTHFRNIGTKPSCVGFAAPYPGTIIPVNLPQYNGSIICQKDAFLCAAIGTSVSIHFNKRIGSGFFGGEGFILQRLRGSGMAFIHAGGTVIEKELNGDTIRLDTGCLVAFTEGIQYDIQFVKGLASVIFGNEGLFLATLSGHGTVWMQSLPFARMADRIVRASDSNQGEGTALTGSIGSILGGDHSTGFGLSI